MSMTMVFMSSNKHYTDEFRVEAGGQVIERGFTVVDVATFPSTRCTAWHRQQKKAMLIVD
jgi:hypothetical protein